MYHKTKKRIGRYLTVMAVTMLLLSCGDGASEPSAQERTDYAALVYPQLDTENSRWFLFSSASRPFGMVNLSPDTEIDGAWGSGYRYETDTIKGFSHVHGWQISGLSVMPVSNPDTDHIFKDFYSPFSHDTEEIAPGYHKVYLDRYGAVAELTSTKRVGFHKYNFGKEDRPGMLLNLNTPLGPCDNRKGTLEKLDDTTLQGSLEMAPTHRRPKPFTLFFHIKLNARIADVRKDNDTGNYLVLFERGRQEVLMKAGISYTTMANAADNLQEELAHWDFQQVVRDAKEEWNSYLGRIKIAGQTEKQQRRFYTDLWHALQGRRVISDVGGTYPDNTGTTFRIGAIPLDENGLPRFQQYNSDSFWGAQWTLNTLWGLAYPDIMEDMAHSLMQYYKDGGWVPRGPSGGNYTYVMTGASSTPFMVSAVQKGIYNSQLDTLYSALRKNHSSGGLMARAGYEQNSTLGGGLDYYMDLGYVPYPIPEGKFGGHQDGASLTLEYAYQDYTLAQLAKRLGKTEDYNRFMERSKNYKNVFDAQAGWMRPKDSSGTWQADFDPYRYEYGFNEANGAQATWFVPHDLSGLAELMGGPEKAVEKLVQQFEASKKLGYTSGTSHDKERHPEYRRIPINYGNQPAMQTAFVFSGLGRPELTQYWSRTIVETVFSGLDTDTGYNGDEDQGLMGSLAVLYKMGLFQMDGGTTENPEYQVGSPIFDTVEVALHPKYYAADRLIIKTHGNRNGAPEVQKLELNGKPLARPVISHNQIDQGAVLDIFFEPKAD